MSDLALSLLVAGILTGFGVLLLGIGNGWWG